MLWRTRVSFSLTWFTTCGADQPSIMLSLLCQSVRKLIYSPPCETNFD